MYTLKELIERGFITYERDGKDIYIDIINNVHGTYGNLSFNIKQLDNVVAAINFLIMDISKDYNGAYDNGYEQGHKDGRAEGFAEGSAIKQKRWFNEGYESGHRKGYDEGHEDGIEDTKAKYNIKE